MSHSKRLAQKRLGCNGHSVCLTSASATCIQIGSATADQPEGPLLSTSRPRTESPTASSLRTACRIAISIRHRMGFWNDGLPTGNGSRSRSRSPSRKYYASRPSVSRSVSSIFSLGSSRAYSSSRHSRARPRSGFVARIRRFLREVYSYMRRHPLRVFLLVIMPLITGGALAKLLAQFGIRLPRSLQSMVGSNPYRSETDRYYARGGARDFTGGTALPGMGGGVGQSISSLMGIAKMFV